MRASLAATLALSLASFALAGSAGGDARRAACVPPPHEHLIRHARWLSGVTITEYYPVPERWFSGRRVAAPGLQGRHRVDWLYSARGLSMEGDGIDLGGRRAHVQGLGSSGWVTADGRATRPLPCAQHWSAGSPAWRGGGWRNIFGAVTFPLERGGWSNGRGRWSGGYGGVSFAPGASLPLRYYRSVAVDPRLIQRGSRIYVPAYRRWLLAQDTGGAILGPHIDVYRPPPASLSDTGRFLEHQRIYVAPPG